MLAALRKVFFVDVGSFLTQNTSKNTSICDLPEIPLSLDPHYVGIGFKKLVLDSDWAFLFSCIRGVFPQALGMSLCALLMLTFDLIAPQLIFQILSTFEGIANGSMNLSWGASMACFFAVNSSLQALAHQHYYYYGLMGVQACINGLNVRIYDKTLQITMSEQKKRSLGSMINYMGSDSEAVADFLWVVVELSYSFFLAVFATISLLNFLGLAGLFASFMMILLVPLTKFLGRYLISEDYAKMRIRDKRVGLIAQVVGGIRVIKNFCWEAYVKNLIKIERIKEINIIDRINFVESISRLMYSCISILISFIGFGFYALLGNELSPSKVFASLALFKIIENSFANLTELIAQISISRVAANRIKDFLKTNNIKFSGSSYCFDELMNLEFEDYSCSYDFKSLPVLRNLNIKIRQGENVAVVGEVGSGKSALLHALLGEMVVLNGHLSYGGQLSNSVPKALWSGQRPYICNLSIQENVCLGENGKDLTKLIEWCGLDQDIYQLNLGINTQIGEKGFKLSGGQNQRLNLLRAACHDAPLVILDDPFSSVDNETEMLIMDKLICGLWKNKTRVVASNRLNFLEKFDRILFLEKGELIAEGSLQKLLEDCPSFQSLYSKSKRYPRPKKEEFSEKSKHARIKLPNAPTRFSEKLKNPGAVFILSTYWYYVKAMSSKNWCKRFLIISSLLLSSFLVSIMPLFLNSWLSVWSSDTSSPNNFTLIEQLLIPLKSKVASEVVVYGLLGILFIGIYFIHHRLWSKRSLLVAKDSHENAISGLLGSPSHFYDYNPIGKILNRFSHDCDTVEKKLPWSFEQLIRAGMAIGTTLVILVCIIPDIIFLILPAIIVYFCIHKKYRKIARDVKRMTYVHKSPRLALFKEILEGLTVIRAFRCENFFKKKFYAIQCDWQKAFHSMILLNRWISVRIPLLSSFLTLGVMLRLMFAANKHELEVGTVGVVLSYTLYLWDHFNRFVRSFSESAAHIIALERLQELSFLQQESDNFDVKNKLQVKSGDVEFENVSISYEANKIKAIKNVSFKISSGEKVGLKGKSGAGKTSLIKALVRMVPHIDGRILLDGTDITEYSLHTLRSSIAVVPQEPILFSGSIRTNLDPENKFSDNSILNSLEKCSLVDVLRDRGGLDAEVLEYGDNFSMGEKQLLCLARAILIDSPIILLDEATACVDEKTDFKIKKALDMHCSSKTVLLVAHRSSTLEYCHKIIELKDGRVESIR